MKRRIAVCCLALLIASLSILAPPSAAEETRNPLDPRTPPSSISRLLELWNWGVETLARVGQQIDPVGVAAPQPSEAGLAPEPSPEPAATLPRT